MKPLLISTCATLVLMTGPAFAELQTPGIPSRPDTATLLLKDASKSITPTPRQADGWEAMRSLQRTEVRQLYGDFFALHEIQFTQADALVNLLAEERLLTSSWSSDAVSHMPQAADRDRARAVVAQIATLLGRERYAALEQYQQTLHERFHLRKLARLLDTAGNSLSNEQKTRMVAILVSERYRLNSALLTAARGSPESADEIVAMHDAHDAAVQTLFGAVLNAEQREFAARHYAKRAERRHTALERYRKALAEGDTPAVFAYPVD
jgi:hypothetical protein